MEGDEINRQLEAERLAAPASSDRNKRSICDQNNRRRIVDREADLRIVEPLGGLVLRNIGKKRISDSAVEPFYFFGNRTSNIKDSDLRVISSILISQKKAMAVFAPKRGAIAFNPANIPFLMVLGALKV